MPNSDGAAKLSGTKSPTALISYSHDSPEHERSVLALCNRLRAHGIDAFVDQFLPGAPSEGWPLWMERQIEQRDFTLMVCTETYHRRFMEIEAHGVGRGVVWEARILRNLLYEDTDWHGRIIPVLLEPHAGAFVPTVFRGTFYDLAQEGGFENLLRHLLREPGAEPGALGSLGPQGSRWSAFERPWLIPDAMRTHYFTGREDVLARLRQHLVEQHRAVLSGLGGVGKTQTALEYAVRYRTDYSGGVFWVNSETMGGLTSGFATIATALRLSAAEANEQDKAVKAALAWLNANDGWLLIFDNADDRRDLQPFMPQGSKGHVLITSRESVFAELGIPRVLELDDIETDEAVSFLFARTGREDGDSNERAAAFELATELGNLPLALEQAAAYIAETNAAFTDYLAAFRKRRVALLERAAGLVARETVAVTWAANFDAVKRASPAAAEVLRIGALLAPDAVPFELFYKGSQALGGSIAAALSDADELAMAELLRPLARYSLIRSDPTLRAFSMHRLVQEIVWTAFAEADHRTIEAERLDCIERAVRALDATFPEVEFATWAKCERLVPHVTALAGSAELEGVRSAGAGGVLNRAGRYLWERVRYAEAQRLFELALAIGERTLGPDHPDIARSLDNLAITRSRQGRYADAQVLLERALAIYEQALGPDDPEMARKLNNIANIHCEQGRYADAQPLHERALAIRERALGCDHPDVATSLNNLGVVSSIQGRYTEALTLYERALAIWEQVLGPDHPHLAQTLDNLGETDAKLGRYDEAQSLHERALAIRERVLGPNHPQVAENLNSLGNVHRDRGRYAEAQAFYERALVISEGALGPDHPELAYSLNNLGIVLTNQHRYAEAELLFERANAIRERALAPDHLEIANGLIGLAFLREQQGRTADAIALYERALAVKTKTLAAGHPELDELRGNLEALRQGETQKTVPHPAAHADVPAPPDRVVP